jgi:hypothetical protein
MLLKEKEDIFEMLTMSSIELNELGKKMKRQREARISVMIYET